MRGCGNVRRVCNAGAHARCWSYCLSMIPKTGTHFSGSCSEEPTHVAQGQDAVHHRGFARDRACDRVESRARRRQYRDRRQDRNAAPETAGHHPHRRGRDRTGGRAGAAHGRGHPRRSRRAGRHRAHGGDLRRARHCREQCKCCGAHAGGRDRHEAIRSDAWSERARYFRRNTRSRIWRNRQIRTS